MHPTSIEQLNLFGPYTQKFSDLKAVRMAIKRGDYGSARGLLDGKVDHFLDQAEKSPETAQDLAYALKIVINIVYGLTSARFENMGNCLSESRPDLVEGTRRWRVASLSLPLGTGSVRLVRNQILG